MPDWVQILDRFGVSVAVLFAVGYGIRRLGQWALPVATDLIQSHKAFVAAISSDQASIRSHTREIESDVKEIRAKTDEIHRRVHGGQ